MTKKNTPGLYGQLRQYTDNLTGSWNEALLDKLSELVRVGGVIPLSPLPNSYLTKYLSSMKLDSERLDAMSEAGKFFKDAREVAGLNLEDLSKLLGLKDPNLLKAVEEGKATLPLDMIFRNASLLARHDPIPFMLKFIRTYNPAWEQRLRLWGADQVPRYYERQQRFSNLMKKHDILRDMDDATFDRFIQHQEAAIGFTLSVMKLDQGNNNLDSSTEDQ